MAVSCFAARSTSAAAAASSRAVTADLELAAVVEVASGGDPRSVEAHELGVEIVRSTSVGRKLRDEVPVVGADEREAFALAVDDEAGGGGLHAAGGEPGADLAPQHGRDLVAVEAVEDAAGLLRVDECGVDVAGVVPGALDGVFGDLVEHHALDGNLGLQHLEQVPRDGLALAVLISGEVELVGVLERPLQFGDRLPSGRRRRSTARSRCRRRRRTCRGSPS